MNPPLGKLVGERLTRAAIDAGRRIPAARRQRPFGVAATGEQFPKSGDGPRTRQQAAGADNRHGFGFLRLDVRTLAAGAVGLCPAGGDFWKLVEDHVNVQSADAERVDRGPPGQPFTRTRPGQFAGGHEEGRPIPVDLWIQAPAVDRRAERSGGASPRPS